MFNPKILFTLFIVVLLIFTNPNKRTHRLYAKEIWEANLETLSQKGGLGGKLAKIGQMFGADDWDDNFLHVEYSSYLFFSRSTIYNRLDNSVVGHGFGILGRVF